MQVLYTVDDPYAPLVRETLDAAGVAWHSALGRPASNGLAARSLLALLALREHDFAREAVLDWLGARPTSPDDADDPLPSVALSAWDRLSRRAQVLQGADQWVARLERLVETLELERQEREDWHADAHRHDAEDAPPLPTHDVEDARAMLDAIRQLQRDTRPPPEPSTWEALAAFARRLRTSYIRDDPTWPAAELQASEALDAALESLTGASELEPTTTIGTFRETLAEALNARRLEEGQPGVGVLVGPLGSSVGAAFDRTYLVGLAEGLLPSRLAPDPLLAERAGQRDPLRRHQQQRAIERGAFLAAASGTRRGGVVHLSYARSDGAARASFPSRWLLEEAARREGVASLSAADLPRLFGSDRAWLEHIASAYDAVQRADTSMNVADRRLREVVDAHRRGQSLTATGLAVRSDLVLGRALYAAAERRSRRFTAFDGNLAVIAAESRNILAPFGVDSGASSATSLQRWANCPFHYFMVNVLRVEATEHPEEAWTINPLDRGTLVHAVLEQFFRERLRRVVRRRIPRLLPPITRAWRRSRKPGWWISSSRDAPVTRWPGRMPARRSSTTSIWSWSARKPGVWRRTDGTPRHTSSSAPSAIRDPASWAPVELDLGDGVLVRFRGAIDRVDVSPSRVLVIDYKTGGTWGYDGLDADPVAAGRHLQLALYGRAARANVGGDAAEVRAEYRFVSSKGRFERRQISVDAEHRRTTDRGRASCRQRHSLGRVPGEAGRVVARRLSELPVLRVRPCVHDDARRGVESQITADSDPPAGAAPVTSDSLKAALVTDDAASANARHRPRLHLLRRGRRGYRQDHRLTTRIVNVLAAGRCTVDQLAAVTFTEAAAAALRDRVRTALELAALDPARPDAERARCQTAAQDIDQASISTIHAFAGELLRSFPLEAGLPPGFATLDEIQQALHFDDRFKAWFRRDALHEPLRTPVKRALLLGLSQDTLRALAASLEEVHDLLGPDTAWEAPPPPSHGRAAWFAGTRLTQLQRSVPYALDGVDDPLVRVVLGNRSGARQLLAASTEEEALSALQGVGRLPSLLEDADRWRDALDGRNAGVVVSETLQSINDRIAATLEAHRAATLADVLHALRDFVLAGVRQRRSQGVATFHDLLAWARDLLRDNRVARHAAQARYQRDLHRRIPGYRSTPGRARVLSGRRRSQPPRLPLNWRDAAPGTRQTLRGGRSEQSIYRFRGADITIYDDLVARFNDASEQPESELPLGQSGSGLGEPPLRSPHASARRPPAGVRGTRVSRA